MVKLEQCCDASLNERNRGRIVGFEWFSLRDWLTGNTCTLIRRVQIIQNARSSNEPRTWTEQRIITKRKTITPNVSIVLSSRITVVCINYWISS